MSGFIQLSVNWNAEPNAPMPEVKIENEDVVLVVFANPWAFDGFEEEDRIQLRFRGASRWRWGATNDAGWYRGQRRFSEEAPRWGEFYEVTGDLRLA